MMVSLERGSIFRKIRVPGLTPIPDPPPRASGPRFGAPQGLQFEDLGGPQSLQVEDLAARVHAQVASTARIWARRSVSKATPLRRASARPPTRPRRGRLSAYEAPQGPVQRLPRRKQDHGAPFDGSKVVSTPRSARRRLPDLRYGASRETSAHTRTISLFRDLSLAYPIAPIAELAAHNLARIPFYASSGFKNDGFA